MGNVFSGFSPLHRILKEVSSVFAGRGKQVYLVGGAVRDSLRGYRAQDWDLATDALPEEVIAMFRDADPKGFVVPTGIKHGTVTLHYKGRAMEVTTFRTESGYSDGRRPDKVEFGASIEADLSRRDFTMNAIAYKLPSGPLVDPFGGRADIKAQLIRSVGKAEERFAEDGLRPLRAIRFASRLDFRLDEAVLAAIPGARALSVQVAPERARDELDKIIAGKRPAEGLLLMEKTGLLELFLPELSSCRGIDQKGTHRFDVLDHCLLALSYAAQKETAPEIRLAALLHDIGKPSVRKLGDDGIWTFYHHAPESSRMARQILLRFRYPNAVIDRVCHLIEEHMVGYTEDWGDAAVRRFIVRVGEENLPDLYTLCRCDHYALAKTEPPADFLLSLIERTDAMLAQKNALSLKDLAVSGDDLAAVGIKPGKQMGVILRELFEAVLDDPELNTRERLMEIALKLNRRYETGAP